ncbi:MAG: AAA family ATPase [Rhodoferax sp.]|nr:AAA family ATPase [Rhodoferax sp.]
MQSQNDDIRQWLLKQSDWLQETADRLLDKGSLSQNDVKELVTLLKTPQGQKASNHRLFSGLLQATPSHADLRLNSIDEITGIEGLAPRRSLTFGKSKLTVIYGHNGSGKSSYARLLKKVTGKPRAQDLKANVFQPIQSQSRCKFTFNLLGTETQTEWVANAAPIEALRAVDIFDADEAAHYLKSESAAAYTPPIVSMFERLAGACDLVKEKLQDEQNKLIKALPALPSEYNATTIGKIYSSLKYDMNQVTLSDCLTWTDENEKVLNQTIERLKTSDHGALAKQKRQKQKQVQQIATSLKQAFNAYGVIATERLRELRVTAESKRKIAIESAKVESAELEHVGSDTWRAMWKAARAYSQDVYPAQPFPVTEGARCVLCHQELSDDAQERLKAFERFVQSKLESEATEAEAAYTNAKNQLPIAWMPSQIDTQAQAAGLTTEETWPKYLKEFWANVTKARSALIDDEKAAPAIPVAEVTDAVKTLTDFAGQLEKEALQHDADAQSINVIALQKSKLELDAKKWVCQQAVAVRAEVERLKQYKAYDDWKLLTNSRGVSQKSGEVAEQVITRAYVKRFNAELQALGATRIKVELVKTKAEKGKVLHRLQLKGVVGKQTIDAVLSEGERRIVALAAFLADLTEKSSNAPFIFDDPISSLDQTWEERTIERLVQLSETRQVIVFTHRLSFMGLIDEKAEKLDAIHIRQEHWGAGEIGEVPLYGKKPEAALNDLRNARLTKARHVYKIDGSEAYYREGKAICSDFRILLERVVEFVLLADVVQRHRRAVNTQGKIQNLAKIKPADCTLIEELMSKYSRFEHSQSYEAPVDLPYPNEIEEDIIRLLKWHGEFTKRTVAVA